jgi:hypothetical protein
MRIIEFEPYQYINIRRLEKLALQRKNSESMEVRYGVILLMIDILRFNLSEMTALNRIWMSWDLEISFMLLF